jgi:hypothetical protein
MFCITLYIVQRNIRSFDFRKRPGHNTLVKTIQLLIIACLAGIWALSGCSPEAFTEPQPVIVGLQMLKTEAQLAKYPFFNLLSFETDADGVFVKSTPPGVLDLVQHHTGERSLRIPSGVTETTVNLEALHSGRDWPGRWTLIGGYLKANVAQELSAAFCVDSKAIETYRVRAPAGAWTPVMLDVPKTLERSNGRIGELKLSFNPPLAQDLFLDDVVEIDNSSTLYEQGNLKITEHGLWMTVKRGDFYQTIPTPEADPNGWKIVEANAMRVCLVSPSQWVCYYTSHENTRPTAKVEATSGGKLDRNQPGDEDNDGVVEARGAYQIKAAGNAVELRVSASAGPVDIEIAGLPRGKPLITLQGVLIEKYAWLEDGRLLIELPALSRGAEVAVRVGP